ncbi:MAG: hypothetical protein MJE77_05100 [Proteobacteria bacterium]|nr:hypothetical protein [Pseudomonadota bacterium]
MPVFDQYALTREDLTRLECAPRRFEALKDYPRLGRYTLVEQIACQPPDECFRAFPHGRAGSAAPEFLRVFPRNLLSLAMAQWLRVYADVRESEIERIFELGILDRRCLIASEYIYGANIADIARTGSESKSIVPWPLALALFCATLSRLVRLHAHGLCHGHLTTRSIRLTIEGEVWLCRGLPHSLRQLATSPPTHPVPLSPIVRARDIVSLGRVILPLAAGSRAQQVRELFTGDDVQGFAVLSDLIIEQRPELADLAVAALRPVNDAHRELTASHADELTQRAMEYVSQGDVRQLMEAVARSSPDYHQQHGDLRT